MERFGDMASQIPVVLVFLLATALLIALLIPMQLIFGVEKSRVVISGACGVIGASVIAFAKLVKTNVLNAFLFSYAISARIMERKEF